VRSLWLSVWPPLPPDVYLRRPAEPLPFPLADSRCRIYARARQGIWHGVRALGLGRGDEVLAPAYHHGSEIEALLRVGLECGFYDCGETLEPLEEELEALMSPGVRALLLIHYLGFPQDAARWRRWCDDRGLLLIEDAAQAWLSSRDGRPTGSFGDLAVFCLYKTFGILEGAAVVCQEDIPELGTASHLPVGDLLRRNAAWLALRSPALAALAAPARRRPEPYSLELDHALGDPYKPPWASVPSLTRRLSVAGAAAQRRANYRLLLDPLGGRVAPPHDHVPEGASPFVFPLSVENKAETIQHLNARGIRVLDFWSVPHASLRVDAFPNAAARRRRVVGLPVHQELRARDIDGIVAAVRDRRGNRPAIRFERIRDFDVARSEWQSVAERSQNVFATWEWARTWWRHFGRDRQLLLTVCRGSHGRAVAIVPLYMSPVGPFRTLRFVGQGPADELGPVCAPADRGSAARTLLWALRQRDCRWDVFLAEALPVQDGWPAVLGGTVWRRESSPVLDIAGLDWEGFLASRSANFREQVRRRERSLARSHELRYRLTEDPARLDADLDVLFRLHDERWAEERSSALTASVRGFHREFARLALQRGWLRLWIMEIDGEPVAAWYGFRFGGAESYYQSGRRRAWDRASVGFVLLAHSLREAIRDGMREYRLLRGGEPYKTRFASRDDGLEMIVVPRGLRGHAALGAGTAALALPANVRNRARDWLDSRQDAPSST
jgi:CelD/BcsL family acetyltransferase involved in cellulose biosynthesis